MLFHCVIFSEYEEKLQALFGVRDELEKVSSEKNTMQRELSNLEGKYKVMETLRESQETELQTLKVWTSATGQESVLENDENETWIDFFRKKTTLIYT